MKSLALLLVFAFLSLAAWSLTEKCLALSNKIIENLKGKALCNSTMDDMYCMKAGFPERFDLEAIKTICDTTAKATKVSINWHINYDKNYEKEFVLNGKKILVTIYFNDKYLYFEFPKE